jgi:hypothetical protein
LAVSPASDPSPPLTTSAQLTIVELAAAYLDFADGYYRKDGQGNALKTILAMPSVLAGDRGRVDGPAPRS